MMIVTPWDTNHSSYRNPYNLPSFHPTLSIQ